MNKYVIIAVKVTNDIVTIEDLDMAWSGSSFKAYFDDPETPLYIEDYHKNINKKFPFDINGIRFIKKKVNKYKVIKKKKKINKHKVIKKKINKYKVK